MKPSFIGVLPPNPMTATPPRGMQDDGHDEADPEAATHPAYAAHFTDPMYSDAAGEFTPFGNDEGADAFFDLAQDRPALERGTLAYVFRDDAEFAENELAKRASRSREDLYLRVIALGFRSDSTHGPDRH